MALTIINVALDVDDNQYLYYLHHLGRVRRRIAVNGWLILQAVIQRQIAIGSNFDPKRSFGEMDYKKFGPPLASLVVSRERLL